MLSPCDSESRSHEIVQGTWMRAPLSSTAAHKPTTHRLSEEGSLAPSSPGRILSITYIWVRKTSVWSCVKSRQPTTVSTPPGSHPSICQLARLPRGEMIRVRQTELIMMLLHLTPVWNRFCKVCIAWRDNIPQAETLWWVNLCAEVLAVTVQLSHDL